MVHDVKGFKGEMGNYGLINHETETGLGVQSVGVPMKVNAWSPHFRDSIIIDLLIDFQLGEGLCFCEERYRILCAPLLNYFLQYCTSGSRHLLGDRFLFWSLPT